MTTAKTLLRIVKQYSNAAEISGLRPQQIRYSFKRLSDLTGLSREAVKEALTDENLGFVERGTSQWSIGKDYSLKHVENNFSALSGDLVKITWWAALPKYNWDENGSTINVTKEEQVMLGLVRKTIAEGKTLEDVSELLNKPLGEKQKEVAKTVEVIKEVEVNKECNKEHMPTWMEPLSNIIRAIEDNPHQVNKEIHDTKGKHYEFVKGGLEQNLVLLQVDKLPRGGYVEALALPAFLSLKLNSESKEETKVETKVETKPSGIQPDYSE